jgi:tryptophan-rich sensory protein
MGLRTFLYMAARLQNAAWHFLCFNLNRSLLATVFIVLSNYDEFCTYLAGR